MEIQYKRSFTPGVSKRYTLGEIQVMLGYAMEIATPRPRMKEGRMLPGQVCMLLFGITPEEYALKDGDSKALNALAEKLEKNVPADRLLGWRMLDLKGAPVQSALQPQTGESIDGGAFAQRVQARAAQQASNGALHQTVSAAIRETMNADVPGENARLRKLMMREVEFGKQWKQLKETNAGEEDVRGALEGMLTMRNFAWREVGNAALYALCAGGAREKCVLLGIPNQPEKRLAVFTDSERAQAFAKRMKIAVSPVHMQFDELAQRSAACEGLVIDAGEIGYLVRSADYEKLRELRGKPPVAVRVQKTAAVPRPAEDMGSLPDPDAFLPRTEEAQSEKAVPTVEKAQPEIEKKGLLRKMFRK